MSEDTAPDGTPWSTDVGWHPDPDDPRLQRYWNGWQWTQVSLRDDAPPLQPEAAPPTRASWLTGRRVTVAGALVLLVLLVWRPFSSNGQSAPVPGLGIVGNGQSATVPAVCSDAAAILPDVLASDDPLSGVSVWQDRIRGITTPDEEFNALLASQYQAGESVLRQSDASAQGEWNRQASALLDTCSR